MSAPSSNFGLHRLYSILTTEANGTVKPIYDKATPVMLLTAKDVNVWLNGTLEEALRAVDSYLLQRTIAARVTTAK